MTLFLSLISKLSNIIRLSSALFLCILNGIPLYLSFLRIKNEQPPDHFSYFLSIYLTHPQFSLWFSLFF